VSAPVRRHRRIQPARRGAGRSTRPHAAGALCRYLTRPAPSDERVQLNAVGQVELKLKTPWRDGTMHLVTSPLEFMQRPRLHPTMTASRHSNSTVRCLHGVAKSRSPWRGGVVRRLVWPVAVEWPLPKVQRSVALQDDEWQVPAAAVIEPQNLTGSSQSDPVVHRARLSVRGCAQTLRERTGTSLLAGFIVLASVPAAVLVLLVRIIGVPLALPATLLYFVLLPLGYIAAAVGLRQWGLSRFRSAQAQRTGWRVGAALLALVLLGLLGQLPWIGGWIGFAALLLGLGAIVLQAWPRRRAAGAA
jgi:Putative transposase